MEPKTQYVIRTEGMYNSFGLGEVVIPGVTLFRAGNYNLTRETLEFKLNFLRKAKKI